MKSKRNKTLTICKADYKLHPLFILPYKINRINTLINKIYFNNCIDGMTKLPSGSIDLILTDPPYTIQKNFGKGTISTNEQIYLNWCDIWISECFRLLKSNGSIYICINWEASSIIEAILKKYFIIKNRITWKRDKGRGAKRNWKNNMEDIWFAVKSENYTFNVNAVKIKKEVVAPYVDSKGNPKDWQEINGKKLRLTHPSNIWTDLTVPFWSMAENTDHPTQKPEKLVERIILASSNKNDLILDPFMGSGTTAAVAQRLDRNFIGFEVEKKFYFLAQKRLSKARSEPR